MHFLQNIADSLFHLVDLQLELACRDARRARAEDYQLLRAVRGRHADAVLGAELLRGLFAFSGLTH